MNDCLSHYTMIFSRILQQAQQAAESVLTNDANLDHVIFFLKVNERIASTTGDYYLQLLGMFNKQTPFRKNCSSCTSSTRT